MFTRAHHHSCYILIVTLSDYTNTKPLDKLPFLERKFWENMNKSDYETSIVKPDLSQSEALSLLDMDYIVKRLGLQPPTDERRAMEILVENDLAVIQPDGGYGITVLGAILFARDLHDFKPLLNKTIRIVQYEGSGRPRSSANTSLRKDMRSSSTASSRRSRC